MDRLNKCRIDVMIAALTKEEYFRLIYRFLNIKIKGDIGREWLFLPTKLPEPIASLIRGLFPIPGNPSRKAE